MLTSAKWIWKSQRTVRSSILTFMIPFADFEVEDSLMAAIPLELLNGYEDTMDSDIEDTS